MKHTILSSLCALVAAGLASAQGLEQRIADVRAAYGADAWPKSAARDGLPIARIAPLGLSGLPPEAASPWVTRDFLPADAAGARRPVLRVEARVADSPEAAQETLLTVLAALSSPAPAPEDARFGVELGDAGYVGPSGAADGAVSWVAFVRGNVAVRVLHLDLAGAPGLDVVAAAREIDLAIAARPALAPGAAVPRPEIARLEASARAVVAGAALRLDALALDASGDAPTLRFAVGGSGQGYVEEKGGVPHLFTTGPGDLIVTLTAIGANGTTAERTLAVDVADDD